MFDCPHCRPIHRGWGNAVCMAINNMELDTEKKNQVMTDFDDIRISLDNGNNFGFFQWLSLDSSIQDQIENGVLSEVELESVERDIQRMKKVQNIGN